jgi:hypothetical protein
VRIELKSGTEFSLRFDGVVRCQRCFSVAEVAAYGSGVHLGGGCNRKYREHQRKKEAHLAGGNCARGDRGLHCVLCLLARCALTISTILRLLE